MNTIKAESINHAYILLAREFKALNSGPISGRQQGDLHELRDVEIVLEKPRKNIVSVPFRALSRKYCAGEFALFMAKNVDVNAYAHYAKKWKELDVDGIVCSAYGERIFKEGRDDPLGSKASRFDYALSQLLDNPCSKNAVIMMRDGSDNRPTHQKDRCCTLYLQFFIRNGKLDMTVEMRSSDFWFGLPYDVFWYSAVMQRMLYRYNEASGESVKLGTYKHRCASLHVYEKEMPKIEAAELPYIRGHDLQPELGTKVAYTPSLDYEYPEWDAYAEKELPSFLLFEEAARRGEDKDALAKELKAQKFHPFMETMGSFLINKIRTRYPTRTDDVLLGLAEKEAGRSRCVDRKVGCCIRDENGSVVVAHNEVLECDQRCDDKVNRLCSVNHAEVCAIREAKNAGFVPESAYVTLYPCHACLTALRAYGVKEVVVKGFSHKGAVGSVTLLDPAFGAL